MATVARRVVSRGSAAPAAKKVAGGYRGAEGRRMAAEVDARQAARKEAAQMNMNMPFRFFCPEGETREIVIVDESDDFYRFEHGLKDSRTGKWSVFTECLGENTNCPVCREAERPAYFAMYLTVIDLTPYTNKDGIEVPWSKKLLVVKSAQQKKITRLKDRHGTLRGMVLSMTRDGPKDANIGNDIEFVEFMSEDDLATYETEYEYEDSQGARKVKTIIGHEVFDYDELFPRPTEAQLRAIVGGRPEAGSRDEEDAALGRRTSRRAPSDEGDWDRRDAAPAARRRPAREIDPDDNPERGADPEAEEEAAPPPRRAASPARPATRPVARRAAQAEEEVEEEATEEEAAPPPRRAAPPSRAATASRAAPQPSSRAAPARRTAQPDPEAEEDVPQRSPASLADRRRALRR